VLLGFTLAAYNLDRVRSSWSSTASASKNRSDQLDEGSAWVDQRP